MVTGEEQMNMDEWKKHCEMATVFLESCFDENNSDDGLTFDERVQLRLNEITDENVKRIVERCI